MRPEQAPIQDEIAIRPSRDEDVERMLAIYRYHAWKDVDQAPLYESPQVDDIKRRRKNMSRHRLPHIVAEVDGVVVGYAYAVPFRKRPAYRYVVKHSIYVDPNYLHRGIGRELLKELLDACAAAGFRQIIGYIDASNDASRRLHERFGFKEAGYLKSIGFKNGSWVDSIIVQRPLGYGDTSPPS
jgi:L-amino acid N-acyltransferase YncA